MKTAAKDFKMTELGPIPKDWEVKRLGELCGDYSYGVGAEALDYDGKNKYLRITDIDEISHRFVPNPLTSPSFCGEEHVVKDNDLLVARTGASVGKSYIYSRRDGRLIFAGFLMKANVNGADSRFVFYCTLTDAYKQWVLSESARSGQPGLNLTQLKLYSFASPPLPEQRKIAAALSDVDEMIAALERLIEKKRKIKTGAMQRLLTGKTRLPGFKGAWVEKRLGELEDEGVIQLYRGKVISKVDIEENPGPYPIYSSSVTNEGLMGTYGDYMFDEELISWSVDGGGNFFYRPRHKFSVTNVCGYMRVKGDVLDCRYLASELVYLHSLQEYDYQNKAHPSVIRKAYNVLLPPTLAEQKAIAKVLGDMDEEIAALEAELAKTRQLKQGMMQELLTGKVRLV